MAKHLQVKFIEEEQNNTSHLPQNENKKVNHLADLKHQSKAWQLELLQACQSLNIQTVEKTLNQIPDRYGALRVKLSDMAYAYRFDLIIGALEALSMEPTNEL